MNRGTTAVFIFIGVAAVATVARFAIFDEEPPDREKIRIALTESIEAGKEGRPGSALDLLARDFEVNGYAPGSGEISRLIKDFKPDIEVLEPEPQIDGNRAQIVSSVKLTLTKPIKQAFDIQNVRFSFVRQRATKWVFFPTTAWKLRRVTLPDDVAQQIGGITQFGGSGGFGGLRGFGL